VHDPRDLLWLLLRQDPGMGVILMDVGGTISWANDRACTIFGVDEGGFSGRPYAELFTEEDHELAAMEMEFATARSRGFSEDDRWHRRIDGSRFWANGVLALLRADDSGIVGYGKLVRNRTDVQEQIIALNSELGACRERAYGCSAAAAEAAHEIRNSLSGVAAIAGALRRGGMNQEMMTQLADVTERQLHLTRRLTEDLMSASAAQNAAPSLQIERTDLRLIVREATHLVGDVLGARELILLAPPAPVLCDVDHERLSQVLSNLLRNAIKFTPDRGRIWIRLTTEGNMAVVRVEDDGIGVDPGMLERIFDAFTQLDSGVPATNGIGMGLAVARETMRLLGGSIQASSDGAGTGATFAIRLPLPPSAAQTI